MPFEVRGYVGITENEMEATGIIIEGYKECVYIYRDYRVYIGIVVNKQSGK